MEVLIAAVKSRHGELLRIMSSASITTGQTFEDKHHWRSPRQRIQTLMYIDLGLENGGFPINISEGGMAFQGIRQLEKGQLIHISLKLPGLSTSVESAAQIAWLNDLGKGGGLRFIDLPETTRCLIDEWLSLQISSCGPTENTPILRTPVETKNGQSAPSVHLEANQDHSSAKADPNAAMASLDSSHSPVAATHVIAASDTVTIPIRPVNSSQHSRFRDPCLETKRRNSWSMPFWIGLSMSLASAGVLGVISFQLHGGLQLTSMSGNPARPVTNSAATAPLFSSAMRTENAPPSGATDSGTAASPVVRTAIDTTGPSEELASPGLKAPASRPAKKAIPLKISRPKTLFQQTGTNSQPVTPSLKMKPPAADIAPPIVALPTNPAMASPVPALLLEMQPPALSPREPVQRSSKFDAAQLIARKDPVYPEVAQSIRLAGAVELHFIIGADGHVHDVTVVKGNPLLAHAAVEAIQAWHYQPARRGGVPVEMESSTVFVFKPN